MTKKQFDVLCVGDTVTDIFVKLADETSRTFSNEQGNWLAIPFGTKIPYEASEIMPGHGNAANAAVAMSRLGLGVAYQTYVGSDELGRETIKLMQHEGVDDRFIHIQSKISTNTNFLINFGAERTILVKHENFDYDWPHFRVAEIPKWIYFSSLSENAAQYHDEIADWLEEHPDVKLAFQPGTWQMKAGVDRLKRIYARSEVVIMNREEAAYVSGGTTDNLHDLFDRIHSFGPKMVVITDGPDGAYASDGSRRFKMPLYPDPAPPVERTGAGDAYASTMVAALVVGHNLESALQWAPINSMSVVQHPGSQAGLLTEKELETWLTKAPEWYHATDI